MSIDATQDVDKPYTLENEARAKRKKQRVSTPLPKLNDRHPSHIILQTRESAPSAAALTKIQVPSASSSSALTERARFSSTVDAVSKVAKPLGAPFSPTSTSATSCAETATWNISPPWTSLASRYTATACPDSPLSVSSVGSNVPPIHLNSLVLPIAQNSSEEALLDQNTSLQSMVDASQENVISKNETIATLLKELEAAKAALNK